MTVDGTLVTRGVCAASLDLRLPLFTFAAPMPTSSKIVFFAGLMLAGISSRCVASLDELVKDSPFLASPGGADAALPPTESAAVEFRGVITTKDGALFGLYDRTKQIGAWVGKEEKGADFVVHSFNPGTDMISFDYQGQKFNLPLVSSKISASVQGAVMPPPGATPAAVATGADQQRLESIAAEVRRRRALRQNATPQAAPAVTPAVAK